MHEHRLGAQHVRKPQGPRRTQLDLLEVRGRDPDALVVLRGHEHRAAGVTDSREPAGDVARARTVALHAIETQIVDHEDPAVGGVTRDRLGERGAPHLLGNPLFVPPPVRPEYHATVAPVGRAGRSLASAPGALLPPRLRTAA